MRNRNIMHVNENDIDVCKYKLLVINGYIVDFYCENFLDNNKDKSPRVTLPIYEGIWGLVVMLTK